MSDRIEKTEEEWRKELTPEQHHVTRRKGTEPAFSGRYWDCKDRGVYRCVCCSIELFHSEAKYDSGTGWPSFTAPVEAERIRVEVDTSHGMQRNEILCVRCDAHLGHVFDDGPAPTGQRYCLNSAALDLEKEE